MMDLHALIDTVQNNCHITDARHARSMTMCTYLLEMQQYYRWEYEIPYSVSLPRSELGNWLSEREKLWKELENLPYFTLPVGDDIDPFDSETANQRIIPEGYVYSAGYGRFGKPHFFLGKLDKMEIREGYTILVSGCEYARDLIAPPAALQNKTIFLRRDAVRRMIWEKYEEWLWKKRGNTPVFDGRDFASDPEAALEAMTDKECEAIILHELGEGLAGESLGTGWDDMLSAAPSVRAEIIMRAARDLLADCLSTLPVLISRGEECSLHFYFGNLTGMRRDLFPMVVSAYKQWASSGDVQPLIDALGQGRSHWLRMCRRLLEEFEGRGEYLFLEDRTEFRL